MKKRIISLISAAALVLALGVVAFADVNNIEKDAAGNALIASTTVDWKESSAREALIVANKAYLYDDRVDANLVVLSRVGELSQVKAGGSLLMGGQNLNLGLTMVDGNIYMAGSDVCTNEETSCGRIWVYGSDAHIDGRYMAADINGTTVTFGSVVEGDVYIQADKVIIESTASVKGKMKVIAKERPEVHDGAEVGDFSYEKLGETSLKEMKLVSIGILFVKMAHEIWGRIYWIIASLILGVTLILFFNRQVEESGKMLEENPFKLFLTGVLIWVVAPIVIILICLTYFGIPLGVLLLIIYVFLIAAGQTFAGCAVARKVFPKMNRYLASLLGVLILVIADIIPVIGWVTSFLADLFFMGYVATKLRGNFKKKAVVSEEEENEEDQPSIDDRSGEN